MTQQTLLLAAGLLCVTPSVYAADIELGLGNQTLRDPAYGYVSETPQVTMTQVRLRRDLPTTGADLILGAEAGRSSTRIYGPIDDVYAYEEDEWSYESLDGALSLFGLEAGARYHRDVGGRLQPYGQLSARVLFGATRFDDSVSGWTLTDPADPNGVETLYHNAPVRDVGASLGLRGTVGVALRFGGAGGQASGSGGDGLSATCDGEVGAAKAPTSAARGWGLFFEGGYDLQTDLRLISTGQLAMGGGRVLGGAFVGF